jgi:hypothetical protein
LREQVPVLAGEAGDGVVAVDQLGEQELHLRAEGLVGPGEPLVPGSGHDRGVEAEIGFDDLPLRRAGVQPA